MFADGASPARFDSLGLLPLGSAAGEAQIQRRRWTMHSLGSVDMPGMRRDRPATAEDSPGHRGTYSATTVAQRRRTT